MAKRTVLRVIGTTRDIARSRGVSERTARRIAAATPGAYRSGRGWRVPLTTREYAKAQNVSIRTAERRSLRLTRITTVDVIRAERQQRDLKAYNWFKAGGKSVLAKYDHNPRPLPGNGVYPYAYTLIAHAPPDIYRTRNFLFRRRMTPQGLRRNRQVRKWLKEMAEKYYVDEKHITLTLRGAYRHGKDIYDETTTSLEE